jgi:hypothetical protein
LEKTKLTLTVRRTEDRPLYILENIVQLNRENMRKLLLKEDDRVLLTNNVKYGSQKIDLTIDAIVYKPDDSLDDDSIRIDQTLRNAIGIPALLTGKEKVEVRKAKFKRKKFVDKLLPSQEVIVRVHVAEPKDMEKPVCAVEPRVLNMIGVKNGGFCELINSEGRKIKLKVLELSGEMLEQRKRLMKEQPDRYLPCPDFIKIEPDIPWIFLDLHARKVLAVNPCQPIRIRRSLLHTFSENIMAAGFLVLIALIGSIVLAPFPWNMILLIVVFLIYLTLMLYKIRKEQLP